MTRRYQAIFIDWDDTIGDWSSAAYRAQQELYRKYRLQEFCPSFDSWFALYHEHNNLLWEQYGRSEITKDFLQRDRFLWPLVMSAGGGETLMRSPRFISMADAMGADFLDLTNSFFSLLPGAEDMVRALAEQYPLTILSNGFVEVQYYKLIHSGLRDCFAHVVLSEEAGVQKPDPRIFDVALRLNNESRLSQQLPPLTRHDVLMIGDSYSSDIQGARAAGIDQLWLCPDDAALTDDSRPATYKVRGLNKILPCLESLKS